MISLPLGTGYVQRFLQDQNLLEIQVPEGRLLYGEHFFSQAESQRYQAYFLENENGLVGSKTDWRKFEQEALNEIRFKHIQWRHDQIKMFGKLIFQPRYNAWHGDSDRPYTYSGLTLQPEPWNEGLKAIKEKIETVTDLPFNSVLMNWYRDGDDYMGWHADDERELGTNPVIGSVNFGAERRFLLRRKSDKSEKVEIPLKDGSFLLMAGALQHHWQHSVPKQKRVKTNRFNLTFRTIKG